MWTFIEIDKTNINDKKLAETAVISKLIKPANPIDKYTAQIEVNKIEAKGSPFQRNWRPSVGWICSFALGYHFIVAPILEVIIKTSGTQIEMPEFDFSQLSAILMALLGMSGLRSYDKLKRTDTKWQCS